MFSSPPTLLSTLLYAVYVSFSLLCGPSFFAYHISYSHTSLLFLLLLFFILFHYIYSLCVSQSSKYIYTCIIISTWIINHIALWSIQITLSLIKDMSSRRSRQQSGGSTRISDDQIIDLVCKLRQLVPEIRNRRSDKVLYIAIFQKTLSPFTTTILKFRNDCSFWEVGVRTLNFLFFIFIFKMCEF
jgi:hypothetical protein